MTEPVVEARDLTRVYEIRRGPLREPARLHAVGGVSFAIAAARTLAVVGESGCGKSTLARVVSLIEGPSGGELRLAGNDAARAAGAQRRALRKTVQMVFQNPYGSLNPRKKIGAILEAPLAINTTLPAAERADRGREMLAKVGLRPEHAARYPHMFSGGQRQRIAIARALMLQPALVVADEPVSALDVSVQAQVLNLLADLQRRARPRLSVHLARPRRRPAHRARRAGDVPRPRDGAGSERKDLHATGASVHPRAAGLDPRHFPGRPARADRAQG